LSVHDGATFSWLESDRNGPRSKGERRAWLPPLFTRVAQLFKEIPMGFCNDDGTHEGYLVGLVFDDGGVFEGHAGYAHEDYAPHDPQLARAAKKLGARQDGPSSGRMRELGSGADNRTERNPQIHAGEHLSALGLGSKIKLQYVKVACSCGWRSPLLNAPSGTYWAPSSVFAPDGFEDQAHALWRKHERSSGKAYDGGYSITELLVNEARTQVTARDIELLKKLLTRGVTIIERGDKPEYSALSQLGLCDYAGESDDGYRFSLTLAGLALRENAR
jgi:hypothetical protein